MIGEREFRVQFDAKTRTVLLSIHEPLALEPTVVPMPFAIVKRIASQILGVEAATELELGGGHRIVPGTAGPPTQ